MEVSEIIASIVMGLLLLIGFGVLIYFAKECKKEQISKINKEKAETEKYLLEIEKLKKEINEEK